MSYKNAVITGVSTGIGHAIAQTLIRDGYRVFGSVRSAPDAVRLSAEWGSSYVPLIMDVTDAPAVDAAAQQVKKLIGNEGLQCLVNNAGIAKGGPMQYQSMDEIEQHFQVNIIGLIRVTKAFLDMLGAQEGHPVPPGKIINISSVAGRLAQPFVGAYVGSKHAVEGVSHSLRRELLQWDIDVVIVAPGAVATPIWDKGIQLEQYMSTPYARLLKKFGKAAKDGGDSGLDVQLIADRVLRILQKDRPAIRHALVPQKFKNWTLPMLLPHRLLDRVIRRMFGL